MEDQIRADATVKARPAWIVNSAFDLLLISNLAWLLLLLPGFSTDSDTVVDFWQIYFLTLPHRWITLFLVIFDPDRRAQRTRTMLMIAGTLAVIVVGSLLSYDWGTRAFVCLGFVDYIWNGWHFASQHAGVLRIYSRKAGNGWPWMERWGLRGFVFLTILRTSSGLLWPEAMQSLHTALPYLDACILLLPLPLLFVSAIQATTEHIPKLAYLCSVTSLYSVYLLSSRFQLPRLLLCMATAAALFHAVEYLAIVSYYARRRRSSGSPGAMRWLAQRWLATLTGFVISLGLLGVYLSDVHGSVGLAWQGLNLWAAFVHYALDGMIWKLRQSPTAESLGV